MFINNITMYYRINFENKSTLGAYSTDLTELVMVGFCVNVGSNDDSIGGIAHFLEHLMFNNMSMLTNLDDRGIEYNAYTNNYITCYFFTGHKKDINIMLTHIINMVKYPNIDKKSVDKERKIIKEENKIVGDRYTTKLAEYINKTYYKGTPLEYSIGGSSEDLDNISVKSLRDFCDTYYIPENICFVIVGNFERTEIEKFAKKIEKLPLLGDSTTTNEPVDPSTIIENIISQKEATIYIKQNKTLKQTYMSVTFGIPNYDDSFGYDILLKLLGTGFTSSLVTRLRLEKNMIYSIDCDIVQSYDSAVFMINTEFGPENTEGVIKIILSVLKYYKKNLVTTKQIRRAKESINNEYLECTFSINNTFDRIVSGLSKNREYNHYHICKKPTYRKITPESIQNLATEIFNLKRLNIFMYGNCKVIDYNKIIKL
jgi:predicted Zn-dependent peptidase